MRHCKARAAFLLLIASALSPPSGLAAEPATIVEFLIPAQPLSTALIEFAKQAKIQVLTSGQAIEGVNASRIAGRLTLGNALHRMLEGSGFTYRFLDDRTLILVKDGESTAKPLALLQGTGESARNTPSPSQGDGQGGDRAQVAGAQLAEIPAQPQESVELEQVVVTGSRLRQRAGSATSSPVIVFDRRKFEEIGAVDVATVLRQLPQSASSLNDAAGHTSPAGSVTVQLRGLADNATLVLIDGRRAMASPSTRAGAADINTIPLSAVERIEVLTDGASAIYGADAVAGVVNIILRKNVNTMTAGVRYGNTTRSDSSEKSGTLALGHTFRNFSVLMSAEVFDRNPMFQSDLPGLFPSQDFTSIGGLDLRTTVLSTPGTILAVSGNLPGVGAPRAILPAEQNGVGLTQASFLPTAGQQSLSSTNSNVVSGLRRYGATARLTYDFAPGWQAFGSFIYADNEQLSKRKGFAIGSTTIPAANPFNPFGTAVRFTGALDQGDLPREVYEIKNHVKEFRGLTGIAKDFGNGWDIEATVGYQHDNSGARSFFLNSARLQTYLNTVTAPATALNLFTSVPFNSSDIVLSLLDPQVFRYRQVSESVDTRVRGRIFSLPGGNVQIVAGAEAYRNTHSSAALSLLVNDAERRTWAGFSELSVPIVGQGNTRRFAQELTLSLAGRYDHYSDFGNTTNPKVSLIFKPLQWMFVRGSWGTFFRAPTMTDAYQPLAATIFTTVTDPRRGNVATTALAGAGGNINLEPEEGESWNAGLGWQPLPELALTLDYWNLRQESVNGRVGLQQLMDFESLFPQFIHRDPPSAADIAAGRPGPVVRIDSIPLNFGLRTMDGVDLNFQFGRMTPYGHLDLSVLATRALSFVEALIPGGTPVERLGYSNTGLTLYPAKWKGTATLGWQNRGWAASLTGRFIGSSIDFDRLTNVPIRELGSVWTFDAAMSYDFGNGPGWLAGTKVRAGGQNIFDRPPEFAFASNGINLNRDDPRGRFLYLDLSKQF